MKNKVYRHGARYSHFRDEVVMELCYGKKVLHIGATDAPYTLEKQRSGELLHDKLAKVASELAGVDGDGKMVRELRDQGYTMFEGDFNKPLKINWPAEVIVFGETLEHLTNFDAVFEFFRKAMGKNTKLIITTPNAYSGLYFGANLMGRESINPDHKATFTMGGLKQLVESQRMVVEESWFTNLNKDEDRDRWYFKIMRWISSIIPQIGETLVVVCRKK